MKSPANSASETKDINTLIIWAKERTGPLSRGIGSFFEQNICNPARLQARFSLSYATLNCEAKTILLAL